jgi:hypothetical protein
MSFWDLLKPPAATKAKTTAKPVTSAELAAALAEAEAAAASAEVAAAEVAERRAGALLTATEADLDAVDRELQLAVRASDKAAAAVAVLQQRLAAAEESERQAGRDRIYAKGAALLRSGLGLYVEYDALARQLAALVEKIADADDAIRGVNRELASLGDARVIADLDNEARPRAAGETGMALWVETDIASSTAAGAFHWRLSVARNLEELPASAFHQQPHEPGFFRSIRPEAADAP